MLLHASCCRLRVHTHVSTRCGLGRASRAVCRVRRRGGNSDAYLTFRGVAGAQQFAGVAYRLPGGRKCTEATWNLESLKREPARRHHDASEPDNADGVHALGQCKARRGRRHTPLAGSRARRGGGGTGNGRSSGRVTSVCSSPARKRRDGPRPRRLARERTRRRLPCVFQASLRCRISEAPGHRRGRRDKHGQLGSAPGHWRRRCVRGAVSEANCSGRCHYVSRMLARQADGKSRVPRSRNALLYTRAIVNCARSV